MGGLDQLSGVTSSLRSNLYLSQLDLDELDPVHFNMVIVDEFRHAEAATYERLLDAFDPEILLGLTATPERTDGRDVRRWFDGEHTAELPTMGGTRSRTPMPIPVLRTAR